MKKVHLGNVQQVVAIYHHGSNIVNQALHLHLHHQGQHLLLGQNKIMDHHLVPIHMDLLQTIIKVMADIVDMADMVDIKDMINHHHHLHQVQHHG